MNLVSCTASSRPVKRFGYDDRDAFSCIPSEMMLHVFKSVLTRNAMQQCHARLYYYRGKGNHQEVPASFPEHPFDRGFHFPSLH
jgi:hypothetical protein